MYGLQGLEQTARRNVAPCFPRCQQPKEALPGRPMRVFCTLFGNCQWHILATLLCCSSHVYWPHWQVLTPNFCLSTSPRGTNGASCLLATSSPARLCSTLS